MEPAKVRDIKERASLLEFMAHLLRQYADITKPQSLRDEYYKTAQVVGRSAKLLERRVSHHKYSSIENMLERLYMNQGVTKK